MKYFIKIMSMLYQIVNETTLTNIPEIKEMFYNEHATNVIFSVILKAYNSYESANNIRHLAYLILMKLMEIDSDEARKCFRIWTHSKDNKIKFFNRILDLTAEFNTFFLDAQISERISTELDQTDYKELILSLKWLTMLCKNSKIWQDYMGRQNNSAHNHNILLAVLELMRLSINRLRHEYAIDLLRVTIRFIIETINAKNQNHINEYVSSGIFEYSVRVIQEGLSEADGLKKYF